MKLDKFLQGYADVLFDGSGDEVFVALRLMLSGMCSARLGKLLNYSCQHLNDDEYYLEIGTYAGFSILSASYECGRKFIGVDDFSENFCTEGSVRERLAENLKRYPGCHTVVDSDFRKVDLATIVTNGDKAGVFLIDGKHTYEDVMESIEWATPHLSDEALIVFDDVKVPGVRRAIDRIKMNPEFSEFFYANSFHDPLPNLGMSSNRFIHNGISLMSYKKGRTE